MNVIYGVPAVPKTFKLSLARLNNPMKHFQKIIVETVFESFQNIQIITYSAKTIQWNKRLQVHSTKADFINIKIFQHV